MEHIENADTEWGRHGMGMRLCFWNKPLCLCASAHNVNLVVGGKALLNRHIGLIIHWTEWIFYLYIEGCLIYFPAKHVITHDKWLVCVICTCTHPAGPPGHVSIYCKTLSVCMYFCIHTCVLQGQSIHFGHGQTSFHSSLYCIVTILYLIVWKYIHVYPCI